MMLISQTKNLATSDIAIATTIEKHEMRSMRIFNAVSFEGTGGLFSTYFKAGEMGMPPELLVCFIFLLFKNYRPSTRSFCGSSVSRFLPQRYVLLKLKANLYYQVIRRLFIK